jgi:FHA domain.
MANQEVVKGQCPNGHFYNKSKYLTCPVCAKMKGLQPKLRNQTGDDIITVKLDEDEVTVKLEEKSDGSTPSTTADNHRKPTNTPSPAPRPVENGSKAQSRSNNSQKVTSEPDRSERDNISERATADSDHDTSSGNDATINYYYSTMPVMPVVGWLVGIKGAYYGECFNLYTGRNEIGRGSGMDVALVNEMSISRKTHAVVIFEPKYCKFYIQAGDSHGLTYLNGEIIVSHKELNTRDIITLGDAVFIFVALCNDKFNWNDTDKYCG